MTTPAVPAWELADLDQLSSEGELSGLNPTVLGAIDQAESSGNGGGINSEGYGGYFGLGVGKTYPGQTAPVSSSLLSSVSPAAFIAQAQIAAAEFASLLKGTGGNAEEAEQNYQGGGTEGSSILATDLGDASPYSGVNGITETSGLNGNPFNDDGLDPFNIFGAAAGAVSGAAGAAGSAAVQGATSVLGGLIAPLKTYIEDAGLVIFGLIVIVVGLVVLAHSVTSGGSSSTKGAGGGTETVKVEETGGSSSTSTSKSTAPAKNSSSAGSGGGAAADAESGIKSGAKVAETAAAG